MSVIWEKGVVGVVSNFSISETNRSSATCEYRNTRIAEKCIFMKGSYFIKGFFSY